MPKVAVIHLMIPGDLLSNFHVLETFLLQRTAPLLSPSNKEDRKILIQAFLGPPEKLLINMFQQSLGVKPFLFVISSLAFISLDGGFIIQ